MKKLAVALFLLALTPSISAQLVGLSSEVVGVWDGVVGSTDLTGYTTYRVYADFANQADFLSMIYGFQLEIDDPWTVTPDSSDIYINSDCGCFDFEGGSILGNAMSLGHLAMFPEAAYDSYWTIGLTAGDSGFLQVLATASNPSPEVISMANPCDAYFDDGVVHTLMGEPHGTAGPDNRVLIAQITTCSDSWELMACFQVFVNGSQQNIQYVCLDAPFVIEHPCLSGDLSPEISQASYDCSTQTANVSVNGTAGLTYALFDLSADSIISTQEGAFTYNALPAGDYILMVSNEWGCMNETTFTIAPPAELDVNGNGICDELETVGCHDPLACNYDPETALANADLCTYLNAHLIVGESMPEQFSLHTYTYGGAETSTYEWTAINGGIVSGQGSATLIVNWGIQGVDAQLTVQETDANGCVGPLVSLIIVPTGGGDVITTIQEQTDASDLWLYPNPAISEVFIEHSLPQALDRSFQFFVFDLNGRMVESIETRDLNIRLDVSAYAAGTYVAVLTNGETTLRTRMVIQR